MSYDAAVFDASAAVAGGSTSSTLSTTIPSTASTTAVPAVKKRKVKKRVVELSDADSTADHAPQLQRVQMDAEGNIIEASPMASPSPAASPTATASTAADLSYPTTVALTSVSDPLPIAVSAPIEQPIVEAEHEIQPAAAAAATVEISEPLESAPLSSSSAAPEAPLEPASSSASHPTSLEDPQPNRAGDEDEDNAPNPLADLMAQSVAAAEVQSSSRPADTNAESTTTNGKEKTSKTQSHPTSNNNDEDDEFDVPLASFAQPAPSSTTKSQSSKPEDDPFNLSILHSNRGSSVVATSAGYIDDTDRQAIERAVAKTSKSSQQQLTIDEFDFEPVPDVTTQTLSTQALKPQQFDEFADVWEQTQLPASGEGGQQPKQRRVLKASREQTKKEGGGKNETKPAIATAATASTSESSSTSTPAATAADSSSSTSSGLSNPTLEKLGIAPTNILDQYSEPSATTASATPAVATSSSSTSSSAPAKSTTKPKREQDQLESNDAALAAAASSKSALASPQPQQPQTNIIEAMVKAHTEPASNAPASAASSSSSSSSSSAAAASSSRPIPARTNSTSPGEATVVEDWTNVNNLREQQEKQAAEDAARLAQQGKMIGIKREQNITRDTPIGYDAALRSLTVEPSCKYSPPPVSPFAQSSQAAKAAAAAIPPPVAEQLQQLKQKITRFDFSGLPLSKRMRYKMFPPKLKSAVLEEERDNILCVAQMKIDYTHCVDHERILCSLYRGLTGDALAPPVFGNHWTIIGFQGNDPSTDLRGAGLFSLLQLLWFLKHHHELMLKIYTLSLDQTQHFPFCTLSTNLTGMCLQALRECSIYGEAKRQNSVLSVINTLYVASFYEMYLKWKAEKCTIMNWNEVKELVERGENLQG